MPNDEDSPLSADAAQWAMENKHLFPVGNAELYIADYASAKDTVEIDLFDDDGFIIDDKPVAETTVNENHVLDTVVEAQTETVS